MPKAATSLVSAPKLGEVLKNHTILQHVQDGLLGHNPATREGTSAKRRYFANKNKGCERMWQGRATTEPSAGVKWCAGCTANVHEVCYLANQQTCPQDAAERDGSMLALS